MMDFFGNNKYIYINICVYIYIKCIYFIQQICSYFEYQLDTSHLDALKNFAVSSTDSGGVTDM